MGVSGCLELQPDLLVSILGPVKMETDVRLTPDDAFSRPKCAQVLKIRNTNQC